MSDRGNFRGGSRGSRGGRGGHPAGDGTARGGHAATQQHGDRPKKESILDLAKYMDKLIGVKFNGGREVVGTLKGYDPLLNLVLDDVQEMLRDDAGNISRRPLGLLVARGTLLSSISPVDGTEEIMNPFTAENDEDA